MRSANAITRICLWMVLLLTPTAGYGRTIVVDNQAANASDRNEGTSASPLKTIQAGADTAQAGDTILVKAGVYREWVVPPRGGTSKQSPITYLAAPGENVSIRASEEIDTWVKGRDGLWLASLDNAFFGDFNPYATRVSGSWLFFDNGDHLGDVYLNGQVFNEQQTLEAVRAAPSTWHAQVGETETKIWANFGDTDPNAALVEIHVLECVIFPEIEGLKHIVIDGFDIRHAAANWAPPDALQKGAIGPRFGYAWVIQNCTVVDIKNVGICIGAVEDHHWDDRNLPDINTFGHHLIRNNTIKRCGQAGIVGAYGGVKSVIEGNYIEDVAYRKQYGGAEIAGIKLHFPIDAVVRNNYISGVRTRSGGPAGIWLDWGSQNTRVTGNVIRDCDSYALKFEVNHGPVIVDHNTVLGSVMCWGDGTLFAHNLFYGTTIGYRKDERVVPWYEPHSTVEAGRGEIRHRDDRWLNNIFVGGQGLRAVPEGEPRYMIDHNVYLDGASKHPKLDAGSVEQSSPAEFRIEAGEGGVRIHFHLAPEVLGTACRPVTAQRVGILEVPQMMMQTPGGKPLDLTTDFFGRAFTSSRVLPGPFQGAKAGGNLFEVWPRSVGGGSTGLRPAREPARVR